MRWRSSLTSDSIEMERAGVPATASPLFFVAGLELRLQGGELGERRVRIRLAIAALARGLLGGGENAVLVAPTITTIGSALASIGTLRAAASFAAVGTTPLAALGPLVTATLAVATAVTSAASLAVGRGWRRRGVGRSAISARRLLGRGGRRSRLALLTARRTAVPARTTPLVGAATRTPYLDELRLGDERGRKLGGDHLGGHHVGRGGRTFGRLCGSGLRCGRLGRRADLGVHRRRQLLRLGLGRNLHGRLGGGFGRHALLERRLHRGLGNRRRFLGA